MLRIENGQTLAEYALLLSAVVLLGVMALAIVGGNLRSALEKTSNAFSGATISTTTTPAGPATTTTSPTTTVTTTTQKKNHKKKAG